MVLIGFQFGAQFLIAHYFGDLMFVRIESNLLIYLTKIVGLIDA